MKDLQWNPFRSLANREKKVIESPEWRPPHDIVRDTLKYLRSGKALDIGAQRGNNALFLAQNGFKVLATDTDGGELATLRERAGEAGLNLRVGTSVEDVAQGITNQYDLIVATRVLNYLPREQALAVINDMKSHTKGGGLNVVAAVTKYGEFGEYAGKHSKFLVEHDELKRYYEGWEILEYREQEERFEMNIEHVALNVVASIIARKPKQ